MLPDRNYALLNKTFESLTIPAIGWNFTKFPFVKRRPKSDSIFSISLMELPCNENVFINNELIVHRYFDAYRNERFQI